MLTVAPGTTAPLGSVTVPRRDVLAFWEKLFNVRATSRKATAILKQLRLVTESSKRKQRVRRIDSRQKCLGLLKFRLRVSNARSFWCGLGSK
jgi:hypothetical protein